MEAGAILKLHHQPPFINKRSKQPPRNFPRFIIITSKASSSSSSNKSQPQKKERYNVIGAAPKRDIVREWVTNNDDLVRTLPIYVGGASLLAVLLNRTISGIAPVADASSSQSRADLLTLGLAVTNILTGLVWLSIRPKPVTVVNPQGVECQIICSHLPDPVASELLWLLPLPATINSKVSTLISCYFRAWETLSTVTCCRSLVIIYDNRCIVQIGMAAESANDGEVAAVDATKFMQGSLYQGVKRSGAQSYLANLSLYPGKSEVPFLPSNTQVRDIGISFLSTCVHITVYLKRKRAVILQPLGDNGIAIIGGDTIRGFTNSDQAWITFIGEKLDATLAKHVKSFSSLVQDKVTVEAGFYTSGQFISMFDSLFCHHVHPGKSAVFFFHLPLFSKLKSKFLVLLICK
ncbi:hypothetical protein ACFE04_022619 [Oxalis oulophora]